MVVTPVLIGFISLLVIIPALIVAVVLFLRIESFARRFDALDMRFHGIEALEKMCLELRQDVETSKAKLMALDESFNSLSNKWSARMSVEARRARREEKPTPTEEDENPPVEQQELLAKLDPLLAKPTEKPTQPLRRKFGTFPARRVA